MDINQIITQILAGAFTGYTTNSLAIKMLFKNYGPFGGVIVKTRDEFIENISQLVENDIIKAHTLEETLKRPEVKNSINNLINHFFQLAITKEIKTKNITAIDHTFYNFVEHISNQSESYFKECSKIILPTLEFKDLISREEFAYFSKKLCAQLHTITTNSPALEKEFKQLYSKIKDKKINAFLVPNLTSQINQNLQDIIRRINQESVIVNQEKKMLIRDIYQSTKIEELREKIIITIENKSLGDYNFSQQYFTKLKKKTIKIVNKDYFKSSLNLLIEKNKNIGLDNFINGKASQDLKNITGEKVELLVDDLSRWMEGNQTKINEVFNKLINETLDQEAMESPLKANIKRSAYQVYRNNSNFNPAETLISSLRNLGQDDNIREKINNYLQENLAKVQIGDKSEQISDSIINWLNLYLEQIPEELFNHISKLNISELSNLKKLPSMLDLIENNPVIEKFLIQLIEKKMETQLNKLLNYKLEELITEENFQNIYQKITSLLAKKESQIVNFLKKQIYDNYQDKSLELINFELDKLDIKAKTSTLLKDREELIYKFNVNPSLQNITQNSAYQEKISRALINYINENLEFLLKGNISTAIKNNLEKISDEEIKNILEDFVGRELKPITYFGAFLGIFTAFLLYLLQGNLNLDGNLYLPISMAVYGFIGYITNVIAIKMIFKPYQQKSILGIKIPFTPGVVTKEKQRFAQSVGNFIDQELLNHQTLENTIDDKAEVIKKVFTAAIKADDYKILEDFLKKNTYKFADTSLALFEDNKEDIICKFILALNNKQKNNHLQLKKYFKDNQQVIDSFLETIAKEIMIAVEKQLPELASSLKSHFELEYNLADFIPNYLQDKITENISSLINENIELIIQALNNQKENYLEDSLAKLAEQLYYSIKEKTLIDIPDNIKTTIYQMLYKLLSKMIINKSDIITDKLNKQLIVKSDIFLEKIPEILQENKSSFKRKIITQVEDKMGFWSKAGKLVDFEQTLNNFADRLIDDGITEILDLYLEDRKNPLLEKLKLEQKQLYSFLNKALDNKDNQLFFIENLKFLHDDFSDISVGNIANYFQVKNASSLLSLFSEELAIINKHLADNLSKEKEQLLNNTISFSLKILNEFIYKQKTSDLFKDIDAETIKKSLIKIYQELESDHQLKRLLHCLLYELLQLNLKENININTDYLKAKIEKILEIILYDSKTKNSLRDLLALIYNDLSSNLSGIIEDKTADYLLEYIINTLLESLKTGLADLLEEINLKEISVNEINNMSPREIEKLFYSFAGSYLGKLENYGWLGSLVGLLAALVSMYA
ncbi:MAG: DUF445 family protein [Halanaerobiales bacterium]